MPNTIYDLKELGKQTAVFRDNSRDLCLKIHHPKKDNILLNFSLLNDQTDSYLVPVLAVRHPRDISRLSTDLN